MGSLAIILIAGGGLLALAAVAAAFVAWRIESSLLAMRDTLIISVADVVEQHRLAAHGAAAFGQPVEVIGTIECDAPLQAPYSEALCVAYSYAVTEESEQIIGRPGSRQAREFEFSGHDAQQRHVPRFYVRDATGRVAIDPADARLDMVETVARFESYTGLLGSALRREEPNHER
ncbi:MAG: hypothetical protein HGA45_31225, partial [Chloroflexales bacterium]|nr:hypothetical protein [Chloroflexales bacterium]